MSIFEYITSSIRCLAASKMRTFLTTLGIIVGISSVILINILGSSLGKTIENVVLSLVNGNLANIYINVFDEEGELNGYGSTNTKSSIYEFDGFTEDILTEFEKSYGNKIQRIVNIDTGLSGTINASDNKSVQISLTAVSQVVADISNINLIKGRFINSSDVDNKFSTVVISEKTAKEYFGKEDPIGRQISMTSWGIPIDLTVVGVYKEDQTTAFLYENSDSAEMTAYVPYTMQLKSFEIGTISNVASYSINDIDAETFKKEAADYFNAYVKEYGFDVTVETLTQYTDKVSEIVGIISKIIAVIAAISLFVGGIGVMNIMLVSVSERTMEIGVRKAMGANNRSIRLQFLTESIMITFLGSFIGVLWGMIQAKLIALIAIKIASSSNVSLSVDLTVPASSIVLAVVFSFAIGIVFGVYPAIKASKMEVVDALRYE